MGMWSMFDVLCAYVHTYIYIQTHILQYVMYVYELTYTHTHICMYSKATCVALTTFGILTRAYGHS